MQFGAVAEQDEEINSIGEVDGHNNNNPEENN